MNVILIFAQCHSSTALGDYALAGSIAKDLVDEIGSKPIRVMLTTVRNSMSKFKKLYGEPIDGGLNIEGRDIGLCALEDYDIVNNNTLSLVIANHCELPKLGLIKNILSAHTKLLFVNAAHRPAVSNNFEKQFHLGHNATELKDIYGYYDINDILFNSCGLSSASLGLTKIASFSQFRNPPTQSLPTANYGFGYMSGIDFTKCSQMVFQYAQLTQLGQYVIVGSFNTNQIIRFEEQLRKAIPGNTVQITSYQNLTNPVMRGMVYYSTNDLVISTGVMSTLEVMRDGKLPFYEDLELNEKFVSSYLNYIDENYPVTTFNDYGIKALANLLFASKPLTSPQFLLTQQLMKNTQITQGLIQLNLSIVNKQQGLVAQKLMQFIERPKITTPQYQCHSVLTTLRRPTDLANPTGPQALRRAAGSSGFIFELKVLLAYLPVHELNEPDATRLFTALHWAIYYNQTQCAKLLIQAGVDVNAEDNQGRTPLYHAATLGVTEVIPALINAKGRMIIPLSNAPSELLSLSMFSKANLRKRELDELQVEELDVKTSRNGPTPPISPLKVDIDQKIDMTDSNKMSY